jgi:hypothetical protein
VFTKLNKEVLKVLASIFELVLGILGGAGVDPEASGIVSQVFNTILGFFNFGA